MEKDSEFMLFISVNYWKKTFKDGTDTYIAKTIKYADRNAESDI